ncbi:MAG: short chain dehydrogenase [Pseudomonadota bacterium]
MNNPLKNVNLDQSQIGDERKRILLIGASGDVGQAAFSALSCRHDVIKVGRSSGDITADISDRTSIDAMYAQAGRVDAVVCAAGAAHFANLAEFSEEQFMLALRDKVMGQVNVVLAGLDIVADGGSFTLTSGVLDRDPIYMGASASTANCALRGFAMAAALELPRDLRINVVSPGLLDVSQEKFGAFFPGHEVVSSERVGLAYVKSVEGAITGRVIEVG